MIYLFQKMIQLKNEKAENYQALFQNNPTAMVELGPDLRIRQFNQHFLDLMGLTADEAQNLPFLEVLSCDSSEALGTNLERLSWNPQKGFESRMELICRKGKSIHSNVSIRLKVDAAGTIQNVFLSIWDITELALAQEEKKQKEALLEAVFNANANNLIWSIDRSYRFTSFNVPFQQIFKAFFGRQPQLNQSALDYVPETVQQVFKTHYDTALEGNEHELEQPKNVPKQVKGHWKFYFRPIRNEANEVIGCAIYANDHTKEKLTERALRESEKSFRRIFQDNPQGIHVSNPSKAVKFVHQLVEDGVTDIKKYVEEHPEDIPKLLDREPVAANDELLDIFGFQSQQEYFESYKHRKIEVSEHSIFKEIQAYIDGQPLFEGETSILTKSGETKFVRYKVVFPADPEKEKFIYNIQDITERKKVQEQLILSEMRYRTLFDNAFDGIIVYDNKKRISTEGNEKVAQMFGTTLDDFLVRPSTDFFPKFQPDGSPSTKRMLNCVQQIQETGSLQFQFTHIKKDGTPFETEVSGFLLPAPLNHMMVFIFKDITEKLKKDKMLFRTVRALNQKREELEDYIESNMQLQNFAYIASHDLAAPIRTIVSFSDLLVMNAGNKLTINEHEYLNFIVSAAKNMKNMIDSLLTYSRVDSKDPEMGPVNIPNLLSQMLEELQVNIRETHAEIIVQALPENIYADRSRIRQLFQNLTTNALKFSSPGVRPLIEIQGIELEDRYQFSVRDNGIGIDQKYKEQIFRIFRKLHSSGTYPGTGIGLAVCKKVVEQHHGKIWYESPKGKGTTFHFTVSIAHV
ncbi:MAG: PAS domain S-box protein, partial [Bacteroidota bacterium]